MCEVWSKVNFLACRLLFKLGRMACGGKSEASINNTRGERKRIHLFSKGGMFQRRGKNKFHLKRHSGRL